MATARLDYVAPWWTYWLHNFPHFDFLFQSVDNTFRPEEANYQQVGNCAQLYTYFQKIFFTKKEKCNYEPLTFKLSGKQQI